LAKPGKEETRVLLDHPNHEVADTVGRVTGHRPVVFPRYLEDVISASLHRNQVLSFDHEAIRDVLKFHCPAINDRLAAGLLYPGIQIILAFKFRTEDRTGRGGCVCIAVFFAGAEQHEAAEEQEKGNTCFHKNEFLPKISNFIRLQKTSLSSQVTGWIVFTDPVHASPGFRNFLRKVGRSD
jgi:hypothetical protein